MKALILAAGLGTRLMPLTESIPKALLKLNGTTLLEIAIRKLASEGFNEIIVNVHHHAGQVIEFLSKNPFKDLKIAISDETEELLDTGGAILKARWFLDGEKPFAVHNVDIISNISFHKLLADHLEKGSLATLSVMDRQTKRYFLFDETLRLNGWTDTSTGEIQWAGEEPPFAINLAFSGIHIISPEIFSLMNESGKFSIIGTYLKLAATHPIYGSKQESITWFDLGKPEQIEAVSAFLKENPDFIPAL